MFNNTYHAVKLYFHNFLEKLSVFPKLFLLLPL